MRAFVLLLLLAPLAGICQHVQNIKAVVQGDKIIITYDIVSAAAGEQYDVQLYASHNSFSAPLQRVRGDVGSKLLPGTTKKIEWDAKAELKNFKGELTFEIWVDVVSIFAFKKPISNTKRGKTLVIDWQGGTKHQDVTVELLRDGVVQTAVAAVDNSGNYKWIVPSKQKTGSGYQVRLVNGKNEIKSEPFSIKPKIPLLIKIIPVAVAGVVIGLVAGGGEAASPESSKLPKPPDLGLN